MKQFIQKIIVQNYANSHSSLSLINAIYVTYKPPLVIEKKLIVPSFPSE